MMEIMLRTVVVEEEILKRLHPQEHFFWDLNNKQKDHKVATKIKTESNGASFGLCA